MTNLKPFTVYSFVITSLSFIISCGDAKAEFVPEPFVVHLENGDTVWKIETQDGWWGYTSDILEEGFSETPDEDYFLNVGNQRTGYEGRFVEVRFGGNQRFEVYNIRPIEACGEALLDVVLKVELPSTLSQTEELSNSFEHAIIKPETNEEFVHLFDSNHGVSALPSEKAEIAKLVKCE